MTALFQQQGFPRQRDKSKNAGRFCSLHANPILLLIMAFSPFIPPPSSSLSPNSFYSHFTTSLHSFPTASKLNMRSTLHSNPFLLSFVFTLILLSASSSADDDTPSECESHPEPVSLELVHRHDPRIPGNENVKLDKHEIIRNRALIDLHRRGLSMVQMPIRTGLDYSMYGYYVQLRVGTPPQNFWMIADTGSELAWIRCNDKLVTDHGDGSNGFSRQMSKTYKQLTCGDPECKSDDMIDLGADECRHQNENCTYTYMYAHGTIAYGDFGTDVVTLGLTEREKKGTIDGMMIGCTTEMEFGSDDEGDTFRFTDGILGLSHAPNSLMYRAIKQYGNKFSYCLMDHQLHKNSANFITFGSYETIQTQKATLSAPMKRTRLIITTEGEYGVQLEGISIGGQMLQLPAELWDFKAGGGVALDTGTSLTALAMPAFQMIGQAIIKALAPKYKTQVGNSTELGFCFVAGDNEDYQKDVPKLGFHFADGTVFEPPVNNYVLNISPNLQCLGLMPITRGSEKGGLIGNIMQQFHLWEFDLSSMTVGFAPSQCTS